jgi:hypothetical protein
MSARDKEKQKQQKLSQLMQRQNDDGRNIAQAQANAETAANSVNTQDKILAEELDNLEKKKLNDMKVWFLLFLRFAKCKTRRIVSEVKNSFTTVFSVLQNLEKPT